MKLILYSRAGCCLCEGLLDKLQQIHDVPFELEVRDIDRDPVWLGKYQYEVPVLCVADERTTPPTERALPRLSPRAPVTKLAQLLRAASG